MATGKEIHIMSHDLATLPEYQATMDELKAAKRTAPDGSSYWMAGEVFPILGYSSLRKFEAVLDRATDALKGNGLDPSHHIALTGRVMRAGKGAQINAKDFYLSHTACYLIALNGDPSKAQVAAAQAYFAVQTRRMEIHDETSTDARRLEERDKVTESFKRVSGVAKDAGVVRQALFHDARHRGLYGGLSSRDVCARKGIGDKENLFERAGEYELSIHRFQMNLAAEVIAKERIKGELPTINKNRQVAEHVRETVKRSRGTMPEDLPIAEPIKAVKKRLENQKRIAPSDPSTSL
jgi:DNA-damage-inducible protein D